jgi:cation:H+ antiporter
MNRAPEWQRHFFIAAGCALAGLLIRLAGPALPVQLQAVGLGVGLVGASFLLAWAADAGETVFHGGLVLAVIALVAVLPELVVETRFAFIQQTGLVTANLTGATRLLLTGATALPLLVAFLARRRGATAAPFSLAPSRRLELGMLLIAAVFAVQIVVRGRLTLIDGVILVALYVVYARRIQGSPEEEAAVLGVPAGLLSLPPQHRRALIAAVILGAAAVVIAIANPFADALLATGAALNMDPYFLIQSVVPLASEAPELVVVAVLVANRRPAQGLAVFLASSVSQWTLAMGLLPIAYVAGGGGPAMPLGGHEQLELAFTAALTLFAVAALLTLKPARADALLIVFVLGAQFIYPTSFMHVAGSFVLLVFAVDLLLARRRAIRPALAPVFARSGR